MRANIYVLTRQNIRDSLRRELTGRLFISARGRLCKCLLVNGQAGTNQCRYRFRAGSGSGEVLGSKGRLYHKHIAKVLSYGYVSWPPGLDIMDASGYAAESRYLTCVVLL